MNGSHERLAWRVDRDEVGRQARYERLMYSRSVDGRRDAIARGLGHPLYQW
jgi:hypothetical protein